MRRPAGRRLAPLGLGSLLVLLVGCATRANAPRAWSPDDVPEAYAHSVGALMWPGGTRAFLVTPEGDLYNGAWHVRIRAVAGESLAAPPRTIASEDRWMPVVRWTRRVEGVRWDYEAVACPEDEPGPLSDRGAVSRVLAARDRASDRRRVDALFASMPLERADALLARAEHPLAREPIDRRNVLVSMQVTATNEARDRREVRSELEFEPLRVDGTYREPDSLWGVHWNACWGAGARDSVMGAGPGEVTGRTLTTRFTLGPGEQRTLRVALPVYPLPQEALQRWAHVAHAHRVREVRAYWFAEMDRGAAFDVPDAEVMRAWRAANVVLLSLRERRLQSWVPIGGPFHYRGVWLRDGARALHALAIAGYTRESRAMAESFLEFQWSHGPFRSQGGQLDGTGQALWAFEQTMLRPTPSVDVRRYARAAANGWRSLERARRLEHDGVRGARSGLLPITDPHDAELIEAQLVGNDAWSIAGYHACVRLLRAAGERALADSIEATARDYERTFVAALESMNRADIAPSWQDSGTDWGNLAVGYPCRVLPASDAHLMALARRYWAPMGGSKLGYYRDPDAAHTYVAADLGTWAMLAGHRALADSVLDACLAWRSASGGSAEIFSLSQREFGVNYPPHPTSAAAIVALVRNGLLYDDADTLQLTLGARTGWWRGTHVRRAPSRFGLIDLDFARRGGEAQWTWTPVAVWTAVTLPPSTRLAGPLPSGCRRGERQDVVLVPPGRGAVRLSVEDVGAS